MQCRYRGWLETVVPRLATRETGMQMQCRLPAIMVSTITLCNSNLYYYIVLMLYGVHSSAARPFRPATKRLLERSVPE